MLTILMLLFLNYIPYYVIQEKTLIRPRFTTSVNYLPIHGLNCAGSPAKGNH